MVDLIRSNELKKTINPNFTRPVTQNKIPTNPIYQPTKIVGQFCRLVS